MAAANEKFLPMTVHNIGFLLDRLGQDCHPLQFLRELTQNSIEAILRTGGKGEIVWDMDWLTFELEGLKKLCITDNGDGMTGNELVKFINQLSSSMSSQSMFGNYGVGAKITAATRNPYGVLYLSWKNQEGWMIEMYRDKRGQYGLKQWEYKDGSFGHFLTLENDVKPELINTHGTKVVLLGQSRNDNTMNGPAGSPSPSRWISKYLNSRYFQFPAGITVKAREGWGFTKQDDVHSFLRQLTGQGPYLKQHSNARGILALSDATVHWWILKEDHSLTTNSGHIEAAGHMGALYQNELYETATGRAAMTRLQQFGITFGFKLVVIYVEPTNIKKLTTNTARTILLINNESLPWAEWAIEFRNNMPAEISKLIEDKAAASSNTDHSKNIRDRLKDIMSLFKLSRYLPSKEGVHKIDEEKVVNVGSFNVIRGSNQPIEPKQGSGGTGSNVYAVFEKSDGLAAKKVNPDPFPKVRWVSVKNGTREQGDIEDRAAKYLYDENLLFINADFNVFIDLIEYYRQEYKNIPGVDHQIEEAVRSWVEQALVETIIGVQGLLNRKEWSRPDIEAAMSQEALTAATMQRYHILRAVKKQLVSRIGTFRLLAC